MCAKENGAKEALISQHNIETNILVSLSFQLYACSAIHLYNYRYQEFLQAKVWFLHF